MTDYRNEHEPSVLTEEPIPVVRTDLDTAADPYSSTSRSPSMPEDTPSKGGDVKDTAKEAGLHVAGVAKDQAGNVAAEAKSQAKDMLSQGRDELRQQAAQQQERVASGLRSLSDELHLMATGSTDQGMAADLAREAADRTGAVAGWLQDREPGELLQEVTSFARRRPGLFLGMAAAAGVLAGRLGRGLKEGEPEPGRPSPTGEHRQASQPSSMSADPLAAMSSTEPAYGTMAETTGYGSTVADPVIDGGSGQGRLP